MADDQLPIIVNRLANEGLKTLDFFRSLTPEQWSQPVYASGMGWTPREVLCHLLNAEQGFHYPISDILLGGPGSPEDVDIDALNEQQVGGMDCTDIAAIRDAFSQARITTIEIVRKMQPADLDREGRHPFFGRTTVDKMLKLIYRHNMIHQRDIRRALDQASPVDAEPPGHPEAH